MSEQDFKRSYKSFAITQAHLTKYSADQYVSYLNKVCQLPGMHKQLERIAAESAQTKQIQYVEELCDAIATAYDDPHCPLTIKELSNGQSAAHLLLAFVSKVSWVKHKGLSLTFTQIFSKKAVVTTFKGRLRTQDRIYPFGAFAADLLAKMATRHKFPLYNTLIDETKFIYDDKGNFFYLKDIDRVMLANDSHAYFEKDGEIYPIFTEVPGTGIYHKITAVKMRHLSLDHDYPLKDALSAYLPSLPEYKKLSDDILLFAKEYKILHPRAKAPKIMEEYDKQYTSRIHIDELQTLREVKNFLDALHLTIMLQCDNSAKSNRTISTSAATTFGITP